MGSVNSPINKPTRGNKNIFFEIFSRPALLIKFPIGNIVKNEIISKKLLKTK